MPANPTGPVFVGRDGETARVTIRRPFVAAAVAAGWATQNNEVIGKRGKPLKRWKLTWRIHDLRHVFVRYLRNKGVSDGIIAALVGQTATAITETYGPIEDETQREAADMVGDFFTQVRNAGSKVIAISRKTGTK